MATLDDVREMALNLPEVEQRPGRHEWRVRDRLVVWERPLRKADYLALGEGAPDGTIVGVRVADIGEQQALVQSGPEAVFITPHFEGYPYVLIELNRISLEELRELIVESWLIRAPKRLSKAWLQAQEDPATD